MAEEGVIYIDKGGKREAYQLVVLEVTSINDKGQPRSCRIIRPNESVPVQEGSRFITGFLHKEALEAESH